MTPGGELLMPVLADVFAAADALTGIARVTPVLDDDLLDDAVGAQAFVKAEFLQRGGSFKFRGMFNKLRCLPGQELERGAVMASSGNAGLGLALAARALRTTCVIVMPQRASAVKRAAIEAAGGRVVTHGESSDEMFARAIEIAAEEGRNLVHPFDQPEVVAGQATVGLELERQLPGCDAVLVPTGGGGLLAGIALVLRELRPEIEIIGVEPEAANGMQRSLAAGRVTPSPGTSAVAEGLAVRTPGELAFRLVERHADAVVTVSDDAIMRAVGILWNALHVAVEPSGAAAIAGLMTAAELRGKRVAVVASGANVDPRVLCQAIEIAASPAHDR